MNSLSSSPAHIATQQEKLDALFGITNGQDIDTFLDGLSLEQAEQQKNDTLSAIDQLSSLEQNIQSKIGEIQSMPMSFAMPSNELSIQMMSTEHSLKELEDLVDLSKDIIRHVHSSILATPLIDSEAVQAYSKLVESIHISIAEFIGVYRDKQNFINKVKFAMIDKQNKKELLRYKTDLQKELIQAKEAPKSIEVDGIETNKQAWNMDQIAKILDKQNPHE